MPGAQATGEWQFVRFKAMGGPAEIRACHPSSDPVRRAVAEIDRLERKYSRFLDNSMLSVINAAAGKGPVCIDDETAALLSYADHAWRLSNGKFDITSGVLRSAWDFRQGKVPDKGTVADLLDRIGWSRVEWGEDSIVLPVGMELDFGGLVKEYAADRVVQLLADAGCRCALVELAGDIAVFGPLLDDAPWLIRVRDPRRPDTAMTSIEIENGAVATSGDYERYLELDGIRYSHILNPHTGWPVRGLASVTVVHDSCLVAGTLATIAMLKGTEGRAWLDEQHITHFCLES